jgi:hypothetical protein
VVVVATVVTGLLVSIAPARRAFDSPLIRINASIGNVSLYATRAAVEARYGAPESSLAILVPNGNGAFVRYRAHGRLLLVTYDATGRVVAVETDSTQYRTTGGVGPGSPAGGADRLAGFRTEFCTLGRWNGGGSTGASDIVTVLRLAGDRVESVLIGQAGLLTACNTSSGELAPAVGDGGFTVTALVDPPGGGWIRSTPYGIDCPLDCSELVLPGSLLTIVAHASVGFTFERWGGDCEFLDPCVVRADGPRHVVAHFRAPPPPPPPPPPEEEPPGSGGGEES